MKYSVQAFLVAVAVTLSFAGCDVVNDPIKTGSNGCTSAEPDFTPRVNPKRKVLLEDFTGHRCGNCPRAAEAIHDLEVAFPDQIVPVGLHSELSGFFTVPASSGKYSYNFRTPTGTAIDNKFGASVVGLPSGMINRKQFNGSRVQQLASWNSHVTSVLANAPDMDIQIKPFYDPIEQKLCAYTYAQVLNSMTGNFNVVSYLVENKFINWQKDYSSLDEDIEQYEHNHIFRKELSPAWGTLLATNVTAGEEFVKGYSIDFDASLWNPDNCYLISFVYNVDTDEVVQAEMVKMIP